MKTTKTLSLVALIGLAACSTSFGWVSYYETSYYPAPTVVERVYTPPVVYSPRVVEETSYIGTDWFSVGTTRERVVYDPVIYDPPVVNRVYNYYPYPVRTSVIVTPPCRPRTSVIIAPRCEPRRTVIIRDRDRYCGDRDIRIKVKH